MMSAIESTSALNALHLPAALKLSSYAAIVVSKLRAVAPYALMELILPGGLGDGTSVVAISAA
jgi:hypothetical protein